jgi:GNAT superfamily N-acetyltransferase
MDVKVYYLQMFAPNGRTASPPRDRLAVLHARRPSVAYYRFLYHTIGKDYHWYSRGKLPDAELAVLLADPAEEIHVLHVDGNPAGFAELDGRATGEIELVQFGLMPEWIGQGLGRYFLQWTIDQAWSRRPGRFWLHTCSLDHPAALPNYLKAGFSLYREEIIQREIRGGAGGEVYQANVAGAEAGEKIR